MEVEDRVLDEQIPSVPGQEGDHSSVKGKEIDPAERATTADDFLDRINFRAHGKVCAPSATTHHPR